MQMLGHFSVQFNSLSAFFDDFDATLVGTSSQLIQGLTRNQSESQYKGDYIFAYNIYAGVNPDAFGLETIAGKYDSSEHLGGWFYKDVSPVPTPPALLLFLTGILGIGAARWVPSKHSKS